MKKSLNILLCAVFFLILVAYGILLFLILWDDHGIASKAEANLKAEFFKGDALLSKKSALAPLIEPSRTNARPDSLPTMSQPLSTVSEVTAEDPVSGILSRSDSDFPSTVRELLAAMPKLNSEQQAEAAQHIANLSDDTLAVEWCQKILSGQLPQPASEVLFNDMLNRPHELLLPFLAKLADKPNHPQNAQSVEILEVLFSQPPLGTPWERWVKIKSQEQP